MMLLIVLCVLTTLANLYLQFVLSGKVSRLALRLDDLEARAKVTTVRHSFHEGRNQLHERLKRMAE